MNIDNSINLLAEKIKESEKIVLINHRRMDGDAYGSLFAFFECLEKLGKKVYAINDELPTHNFDFLTSKKIFDTNLDLQKINPDLIISFDSASISQLGEIYIKNKKIFDEKFFIVIDHHISNENYGNLNIIDPKSSSTCEFLYNIIKKLDFYKYIDENIATSLLMGIITDTNNFFNINVSASTLKISSELLTLGGKKQEIIEHLFKRKTLSKIKLWGKGIEKLKIIENGKVAYTCFTKEDYEQTGSSNKEIRGLISEFLTCIDGVDIAFILYEYEGKIKFSTRSNSEKYDMSKFSLKFGGGGHKLAAGFIAEGKNINDLEAEIIKKIKLLINN